MRGERGGQLADDGGGVRVVCATRDYWPPRGAATPVSSRPGRLTPLRPEYQYDDYEQRHAGTQPQPPVRVRGLGRGRSIWRPGRPTGGPRGHDRLVRLPAAVIEVNFGRRRAFRVSGDRRRRG